MTQKANVQRHFRELAANYDCQTEWRRNPAILRTICKLTQRVHGVALDLGTGTGLVGKCVCFQSDNLIGIDFTEQMLTIAKRRIRHLILADVKKLPLQTASIECCLLRQLLHYTNPASVLEEVKRVLRPDGTVILAHVTAATDADLDWWSKVKRIVQPLRRSVFVPGFHRDCMTRMGGNVEEEQEMDLWRCEPLNVFKRHVLAGSADEEKLNDLLADAPRSVCLEISGERIQYLQHWVISRGRLG